MPTSTGCQHPPSRVFPHEEPQVVPLGADRDRWDDAEHDRQRTPTRLAWSLGGSAILAVAAGGSTFLVLGLDDAASGGVAFGFRGAGLMLSAAFAIARRADRLPGALEPDRVAPPRGWGWGGGAGVRPAVLDLRRGTTRPAPCRASSSRRGSSNGSGSRSWRWSRLVIPLLYPDGPSALAALARFVVLVGAVGAAIGTVAFGADPRGPRACAGSPQPGRRRGADWLRAVGDISMLLFVFGLSVPWRPSSCDSAGRAETSASS